MIKSLLYMAPIALVGLVATEASAAPVAWSGSMDRNITAAARILKVNRTTLIAKLRRMRLLGIDKDTWHRYADTRSWHYVVTGPGFRYHMPNFCAAIGLAQLPKLAGFLARRRAICRAYDERFEPLRLVRPLVVDYAETAPHIYIVRVAASRRDAFAR